MAISVEEMIQLALGRFKENVDKLVEDKLGPIVKELDKRIEEVRAQGAAMIATKARRDDPEIVDAEVVEIGKGKR